MHRVAVLALDRVVAFDLAIPCQVFGAARLGDGSPAYDLRVCAAANISAAGGDDPRFSIRTPWRWRDALDADTIVVPGTLDLDEATDHRVLELLVTAAGRGVRMVSVCTGAFLLAAAGLLDGRRATTHWQFAGELARRYPEIVVDPDVLYVDNDGLVLTSAGLAAGLDLCIYIVGVDHGATVAANTARGMVVPMIREGGQAQFIVHQTFAEHGSGLQPTLDWMRTNLRQQLTLQEIAAHAMTSVRTLNRHFREQVGTTPLQWLLQLRIQRAQELLETTDLSVERIADEVGFGSAVTLRQHFTRRVGVPPQRYRTAFHTRTPTRVAS